MNNALVLPSRGLTHSRTVESVLRAADVSGIGYKDMYFSHDLPMPACFNVPSAQALSDGYDLITIVEDDMVVPVLGFASLKAAIIEGYDVAYYNAPNANGKLSRQEINGYEICGTCIITMTREAVEALLPYDSNQDYDGRTLQPLIRHDDEYTLNVKRGTHDTDLFKRGQDMGFKFKCVGVAEHLRVVEYGKTGTNNGVHTIKPIEVVY